MIALDQSVRSGLWRHQPGHCDWWREVACRAGGSLPQTAVIRQICTKSLEYFEHQIDAFILHSLCNWISYLAWLLHTANAILGDFFFYLKFSFMLPAVIINNAEHQVNIMAWRKIYYASWWVAWVKLPKTSIFVSRNSCCSVHVWWQLGPSAVNTGLGNDKARAVAVVSGLNLELGAVGLSRE